METLETLQRGNCRCGVRSEGARLSRRRALRAGLAPAGAALLAGACGLPFGAGAGSAPADLPPPSQAPATVTYLSATDAQRQQLEQELFADVSRELPHITLTVSNVASWDQVKEQFVAGNAAGTPVGLAQAGWVGPWLDLWK